MIDEPAPALEESERARPRIAELEAENRRKDDFLAILAHELRAPLAAILSAMELLARDESNLERQRRARAIVQRQVRYQARLLDDLLDLTRVARDTIELRRTAVDLAIVIAAAVDVTRPAIDERRQRFTVAVPGGRLPYTGDPVRLEQVVINLLTNATKYTPVGGAISLAVERHADAATIIVRDSGEGIAGDMLQRVFEPFVRAGDDGARARPGGLGVGLTVAKRLVELHGGTIEARSAGRGHGSEFRVRLPLNAASDLTTPATMIASPPTSSRCILVLEDDRDTRDMLCLILEMEGHRVIPAATGGDAIRLAADVQPDVMLIDVGLPDVDGHEVASRIRAAFGHAILLVALTGHGGADNVRKAKAAGFDAHVLKPATLEELRPLIAQPRPGHGSPAPRGRLPRERWAGRDAIRGART